MSKTPLLPHRKKHLAIGGSALAAAGLLGGYLYSRGKKKENKRKVTNGR